MFIYTHPKCDSSILEQVMVHVLTYCCVLSCARSMLVIRSNNFNYKNYHITQL